MPIGTFARLAGGPPRVKCANPQCGKLFAPRQDWQKYCTVSCRRKHEWLRYSSGTKMLKQLLTGNLVLQDLAEKILAERRLVEMGKAGEVGEVGEVGKAGEMREGAGMDGR